MMFNKLRLLLEDRRQAGATTALAHLLREGLVSIVLSANGSIADAANRAHDLSGENVFRSAQSTILGTTGPVLLDTDAIAHLCDGGSRLLSELKEAHRDGCDLKDRLDNVSRSREMYRKAWSEAQGEVEDLRRMLGAAAMSSTGGRLAISRKDLELIGGDWFLQRSDENVHGMGDYVFLSAHKPHEDGIGSVGEKRGSFVCAPEALREGAEGVEPESPDDRPEIDAEGQEGAQT